MSARCAPEPGDGFWPPRLALLAGGLATRLRPLTASRPKSLVEVAGEPFLAHQLRLIRANGIREVILCCGRHGDQIENFAGDGSRFDLAIRYSYDGAWQLGTGGALRAALPLLGRRFLVMYGDSWLTEPIRPVWQAFLESGKPALMTVFRNSNRWGRSNADYRNGLVARYESRCSCPDLHYIDYGLEALDAKILAAWHDPIFDLRTVWTGLASCRMLAGYETSERFYEIGSFQGLQETEEVIAGISVAEPLPPGEGPSSPLAAAPAPASCSSTPTIVDGGAAACCAGV